MNKPDIVAAGAVVLRREPTPQVLVVHRPKYDDWSLPKGKAHKGEPTHVCAVREVAEETAVDVRLGPYLGADRYPFGDLVKQVDWWVGEIVSESGHAADAEIDDVRWLPIPDALQTLSYAIERERVLQALTVPVTTPLLITRHAKALDRKRWSGVDTERPLTDWGRRQARALVPLLTAFGVRRVISSTSARCTETITPYLSTSGLKLEGWPELTEECGKTQPAGVAVAMHQLLTEVASTAKPTVICGHRPVLPIMLSALDLADRSFATGEVLVAHITREGAVHDLERITPHTG